MTKLFLPLSSTGSSCGSRTWSKDRLVSLDAVLGWPDAVGMVDEAAILVDASLDASCDDVADALVEGERDSNLSLLRSCGRSEGEGSAA